MLFRFASTVRHASLVGAFWLLVVGAARWRAAWALDQTPINPTDEAYLFTPPGFDREGKPAVTEGPTAGRLHVTIVDAASGQPTPCRVNVVGADGNYYQPRDNRLLPFSLTGKWPDTLAGNRPGKAPIRYFGRFFYTPGEFTVEVPAGRARIEVWKGFEYRPETLMIDAATGESREARISLTRAAPMAAEGWYSGDPHLHFICASGADDDTIFDLLEAEDVRMGFVLCYNENTSLYGGVMPEMATPQLHGLGLKSACKRGDYQIISGQEYRNGVLGHLNLFCAIRSCSMARSSIPTWDRCSARSAPERASAAVMRFMRTAATAWRFGPTWCKGRPTAWSCCSLASIAVSGSTVGITCWGPGFAFPALRRAIIRPVASWPIAGRMCMWTASRPSRAGCAARAEGRSFMTTGPLVLLEVDGHRPGDTITTPDGAPVTVNARVSVRSEAAPVTDVQLIVNGRVERELKVKVSSGESQKLELSGALRLSEPSWIAARAFSTSPSGSADAESHTNPVYVHLNGQAPYNEADLDWLVERIDEQIADHLAEGAGKDGAGRVFSTLARVAAPASPAARGRRGAVLRRISQRPRLPPPANCRRRANRRDPKIWPSFSSRCRRRSPQEAAASFEVLDGFRMELVAHEPQVTDPVAACFDEDGGMYVCEMIDYPYRPKEGETPLGRVRYLQDSDGDGTYDKSWIFADAIVWPTGAACWNGGVYVAAAPDIWYLKDTDGDHVADVRRKVYSGFGDRNQQGGVNNLAWGIDHAIYGAGSTNGGQIRRVDKPDEPPIILSGRDFRFDPRNERFETVSGSEQFGNAFDDWFNRFVCSESKPAYHVVLPQHYLARNSFLPVTTALFDMAPGVTPIFRTSPIERWREIRSSRRLAVGERPSMSAGVSHNVIDAAAGLAVYRGDAYPAEYRGDIFIGCSQNNLVHHRKRTPHGVTFRSSRADQKTEFVRTTDTWFRPVNCVHSPDGTLFVLDMLREVIESIHIAQRRRGPLGPHERARQRSDLSSRSTGVQAAGTAALEPRHDGRTGGGSSIAAAGGATRHRD